METHLWLSFSGIMFYYWEPQHFTLTGHPTSLVLALLGIRMTFVAVLMGAQDKSLSYLGAIFL